MDHLEMQRYMKNTYSKLFLWLRLSKASVLITASESQRATQQ